MALKIFQTRRANLTQESQHSWSLIWRSTTVTISLPLLYVFYKATTPILCLRPFTKPKFPTTIEFPQSDLCLHYFPTIFMLFNLTLNFVEFLEQPSSLTNCNPIYISFQSWPKVYLIQDIIHRLHLTSALELSSPLLEQTFILHALSECYVDIIYLNACLISSLTTSAGSYLTLHS